jgi:hypothetical protein
MRSNRVWAGSRVLGATVQLQILRSPDPDRGWRHLALISFSILILTSLLAVDRFFFRYSVVLEWRGLYRLFFEGILFWHSI